MLMLLNCMGTEDCSDTSTLKPHCYVVDSIDLWFIGLPGNPLIIEIDCSKLTSAANIF